MKKRYFVSLLILLAMVSISIVSCDKLKKEIFNSFSTNGGTFDFYVDLITDTSSVADFAELSTHLNVDSVIQAKTNGLFGLNDISRISLESAEIVINNPDLQNNISNFEYGGIVFNTSAITDPVTIATGVIPDTYTDRFQLQCIDSVNLKEYLRGTELVYLYVAKARRQTTMHLNCTLNIKLKIE